MKNGVYFFNNTVKKLKRFIQNYYYIFVNRQIYIFLDTDSGTFYEVQENFNNNDKIFYFLLIVDRAKVRTDERLMIV